MVCVHNQGQWLITGQNVMAECFMLKFEGEKVNQHFPSVLICVKRNRSTVHDYICWEVLFNVEVDGVHNVLLL